LKTGQDWAGRRTRGDFIPDRVEFISPRLTLPVSVTGKECALNCAHCGGHYLQGMVGLEEALGRRGEGVKSFLVSGGCNPEGRVPHRERWAELEALALRGSLNFHPGLVGAADAAAIGGIARVVSFDFVVDRAVIEEVYGLQASPDDYIRSYRYLRRHCRVVPHICIGIMGGRIESEYRALKILRREGAEAISFIVFRPTPGTAFAGAAPPSPEETAAVLAEARVLFPRTPLYLGCMRPGGRHREELDCLALGIGINKIVRATAAARRLAVKMRLKVNYGKECCAL
jgi:uncharacterized radical SAM superfamily protein